MIWAALALAESPPEIVHLDAYRADVIQDVDILWDPRFDEALERQTRAVLVEDLGHLSTATDRTVVVTRYGPELDALPDNSTAIWNHRSATWLESAGFDAARAGTIEIWGVERYLTVAAEHPDYLARVIEGASKPSYPDLPRLSTYEVTQVGGFLVYLGEGVTLEAREALEEDLTRIQALLPEAALSELYMTQFVLNARTPTTTGGTRRGEVFHVDPRWLDMAGLDGQRQKAIEIYDAGFWMEHRANRPMALLHELTHKRIDAASDEVLAQIDAAYAAAREAGLYDAVSYVLAPGRNVRAYALDSRGEYACELSEAWFGRNDYFPFTRDELLEHDPAGAAAVQALWGLSGDDAVR